MALLQKIMAKMRGDPKEEEEYIPKQVIDRRLDSLRRERQIQLNEMEKQQLQEEIKAYRKEKLREGLFGRMEKQNNYIKELDKKKKQAALLKQKNMLKSKMENKQKSLLSRESLLNNRKDEFKEAKQMSFLR